jgi:short-subunit dehydrogenase
MKDWALITGASSGFGVDYANILASKGYSLVITARRLDRLEALKRELELKYSIKVHCISSDLTAKDAAAKLYADTQNLNIKVKVLINNAGFGTFGKFDQMDLENSQNMIQLNITALTDLCRLYSKDMKEIGEGYILLVASLVGFMPTPLYSVYAATKAYVVSFGEALCSEFRPLNIHVSTLSPGMTKTEFMDVSGQKLSPIEKAIMMESYPVAKMAIKKLFNKKSSSTPGVSSKLMKIFVSFIPNFIIAKVVYLVMRNKC